MFVNWLMLIINFILTSVAVSITNQFFVSFFFVILMYWNLSQFLSIIGDIYAPNLLLCRFSIHFSSSIRQFVLLPCVASVCSTRFCARLVCLFICVIYTIMSHNVYNVYHKYLHIRSRIWLFLFVTQD